MGTEKRLMPFWNESIPLSERPVDCPDIVYREGIQLAGSASSEEMQTWIV